MNFHLYMNLNYLIYYRQSATAHLSDVPDLVPCQMQIWQEILNVRVKALTPSRTAAKNASIS